MKLSLRFFNQLTLLAFLGLSAYSVASADDDMTSSELSPWTLRLGIGVYSAPKFTGSDDSESLVFPSIDLTYKDFFFASLIEGIGINFLRRPDWVATISGQLVMGREKEGDLPGLAPIDDRVMPKLSLKAEIGPSFLVSSIISDGSRFSYELGVEHIRTASEQLVYMIGAGFKWNNRRWNNERFSISQDEAAMLNVDAFTAGASLSEHYLQGALIYYFDPRYSIDSIIKIGRLTGDSEESPLVQQLGNRYQPEILIRISRSF